MIKLFIDKVLNFCSIQRIFRINIGSMVRRMEKINFIGHEVQLYLRATKKYKSIATQPPFALITFTTPCTEVVTGGPKRGIFFLARKRGILTSYRS